MKKKNNKLNLGGTDERDYEKAIKESRKLYEKGNNIQDQKIEEEEIQEKELDKPKFNAF